jgi:hypothetical protein
VFARLIARIVVLAIAFALLGLIVGLVGKYALKMAMFDNLLLPVAVGLVVGGLLGTGHSDQTSTLTHPSPPGAGSGLSPAPLCSDDAAVRP